VHSDYVQIWPSSRAAEAGRASSQSSVGRPKQGASCSEAKLGQVAWPGANEHLELHHVVLAFVQLCVTCTFVRSERSLSAGHQSLVLPKRLEHSRSLKSGNCVY
jgi:hypothetical protein